MTESPCGVDGCDQTAPGWTVCRSHSHDIERDLGEVPFYARELETTLTRQAVMGERSASKSAEKPFPYSLSASEAEAVLRNTLHGWVRVAVEEDGATYPADTLEGMAAFLLSRLGWLRTHGAGAEAVDEIGAAMNLVRRVVDRPADRWYAGTCESKLMVDVHDGQPIVCDQELYGKPHAFELVCPTCGRVWDINERRAWLLEKVEDELAHASQLAAAVSSLGEPVTADRVRQWAARGRIFRKGYDKKLRPTYRVGDVLDLLHGERRRAG